jgi:hypothetical protein
VFNCAIVVGNVARDRKRAMKWSEYHISLICLRFIGFCKQGMAKEKLGFFADEVAADGRIGTDGKWVLFVWKTVDWYALQCVTVLSGSWVSLQTVIYRGFKFGYFEQQVK